MGGSSHTAHHSIILFRFVITFRDSDFSYPRLLRLQNAFPEVKDVLASEYALFIRNFRLCLFCQGLIFSFLFVSPIDFLNLVVYNIFASQSKIGCWHDQPAPRRINLCAEDYPRLFFFCVC